MMWIEVSVADGLTVMHPLAASRLLCGNRVVVPRVHDHRQPRQPDLRPDPGEPDLARCRYACLTVVAESP